METPTVVFYEHSFDDTLIQSLSKNVLNLGNECRALAEENKRLKADYDRLLVHCYALEQEIEDTKKHQ
jgi:hypothetical protein